MEAVECDVVAEAEYARAEEAARLTAETEARAKAEAQAQAKAKAAEAKPPLDSHDALHWAAASGSAAELRRALKRWPMDVRQVAVTNAEFLDKPSRFSRRPDWIAATPLYEAASRGHTDCVQLLLASQAAVDQPTNTDETPLHASCALGYSECVQLLLGAHAAIERPARSGATPLLSALQARQDAVAVVLIDAHADVGAVLRGGRGVLHCAAFAGTPMPACEELLAAGAACDARDARGRMPLHMAAACGYAALAMRLIIQVTLALVLALALALALALP
jgi:ankyrin repeat protein